MIKGRVIPEFVIPYGTAEIDGFTDDECWNREWPYFVGQKSEAQLKASVCADNNYLYLAAIVNDPELVVGAGSGTTDGIVFQLDTERKGYEATHYGVYSFHLGADGSLKVMEGEFGGWKELVGINSIQQKNQLSENSYMVELSVPLDFFNSKLVKGKQLGINFTLKNSFKNGYYFEENITSNDSDQPFSWCPFYIQ
ncbi:hypothetical protein ES705_51156 [subsurface metagenome]